MNLSLVLHKKKIIPSKDAELFSFHVVYGVIHFFIESDRDLLELVSQR